MLTTVSRRHPNPERSQGSVIFVRKDNNALQTWPDLQNAIEAQSIQGF